jgi:hypothetical protein
MGSTIGAPRDEYETEATELISRLSHARERVTFAEKAREIYPTVPDRVLSLWWEAFQKYQPSDVG